MKITTPHNLVELVAAPNRVRRTHGVLKIADKSYLIFAIPSDWGVAFRILPMQDLESPYDVIVDPLNGQDSCDCMGHLRWGYCKHLDAVKQLVADGELS